MMVRVAGAKPRIRSRTVARGGVRYISATRRGLRSGSLRVSAAGARRSFWHRLVDDRDLVGSKLLVLVALLAVTMLLERVLQ